MSNIQKKLCLIGLFLSVLLSGSFARGAGARAGGALRVVVTIPDLADFVRQVGGDRVEVTSITRGKENLHAVVARPSHLVAMSRADLFVEIGRSLEVSFVPSLLLNSRNDRIQPGTAGFVNVSEGWEQLNVPAELSRKAGDIHPQGNPHLNLDPRAGLHMATRIRDGLIAVDPGSEAGYRSRFDALAVRLADAEKRWATQAAEWAGRKLVVYHQEYNYLARAYGLEILTTIEVKPGIPATPNHLAGVVQLMKAQECRLIVTAPWSNNRDVARAAEAVGAAVVELPNQCGAMKGAETWIGMMDVVHQRLAAGLEVP